MPSHQSRASAFEAVEKNKILIRRQMAPEIENLDITAPKCSSDPQ